MGIMEKNLPVAESLGEGDMVRIVTGGGNSKNVDASKIGGGNLVLTETVEDMGASQKHILSATYNEMMETLQNGGLLIVLKDGGEPGVNQIEQAIIGQSDYYDRMPMYVDTPIPESELDIGYYMRYPFDIDNDKMFYSATPDGEMSYTQNK